MATDSKLSAGERNAYEKQILDEVIFETSNCDAASLDVAITRVYDLENYYINLLAMGNSIDSLLLATIDQLSAIKHRLLKSIRQRRPASC